MQTIEYSTIDKSAWGPGEWANEPDKVQWPDAETGLPCLAVRNHSGGNWCGYVGVPPNHPLHGKDYDTPDVEVHGGLTFAGACHPAASEDRGICHISEPGEPDHVWWFGFDCAHAWDWAPPRSLRYVGTKNEALFARGCDEEYRSLAYVRGQVARLAQQLAAATPQGATVADAAAPASPPEVQPDET